MILKSIEDVFEYCKIDTNKLLETCLRLPKVKKYKHFDSHEAIIHLALETASLSLEKDEKIFPHEVVDNFIFKNTKGC